MKKSYHAPFIFGQSGFFDPFPIRAGTVERREVKFMVMHVAPPIVDPARFAREQSRLTGTLTLAQLPRLADVLFDHAGSVSYEVAGYTRGNGQPALHIALAADLALRCQRCLERLALHLDVERDLVLVANASAVDPGDDEDDDIDTIPRVAALDLLQLIEEEMVLSLPMAARHPEDGCTAQPAASEVGKSASPFSALAGLKTPVVVPKTPLAGPKTH